MQEIEFEVNNNINSEVFLCLGDITKLSIDAIVISANKGLIGGGGGGIDGAIHEATGPGLLDKFQKLNGCKTGECKVTLGYKLPAKYVFYIVRPRDENDYKLNDCYKSCFQKVLAYTVKSVVFFCGGIGIPGFDPRKAAKMTLTTVRSLLESYYTSIDHVIFCTYENAD